MNKLYKITIFTITLAATQWAFSQGCDCTNCPVDLPDVLSSTFTANLAVQGATNNTLGGNNTLQQVCVDITHDWIGDLDITIIAPNGTQVVLFGDGNNDSTLGGTETCPCGNLGDDMVVCFVLSGTTNDFSVSNAGTGNICNGDQSAYVACNGTGAQPCYTGNWLPYDTNCNGPDTGLGAINAGGTVNGNWQLVIHDNAGANQGILNDFYLVFANETGIDCNSAPACPATAGATDITPPIINTCAGVDVPVSTAGSSLSGLGPQACIAWGFWVISDPLGIFPGLTGLGSLPSGGDPNNDPNFVGYWDLPGTTGGSAIMPAEDNGVTYYVAPMTLDNCNNGAIDPDCFDVGPPVQIYFNPPIDWTFAIDCESPIPSPLQTEVVITISGGRPSTNGSNFTLTDNGAGTLSTTSVPDGGTVTVNNVADNGTVNITVTDAMGCTTNIVIGPIAAADHCPACGADAGDIAIAQTGNGNTSANNGTNVQGPFVLCWGDVLNFDQVGFNVPPPPAPCVGGSCAGAGFIYVFHNAFPTSGDPFDPATATGFGDVDNYDDGTYVITNDGALIDFLSTTNNLPTWDNLTTNNTMYMVLTTADWFNCGMSACGNSGCCFTYDDDNDNCFDYGVPIEVIFLNPIVGVSSNQCDGVSITLSGGAPEFIASPGTYSITNNGNGTLSNAYPVLDESITIEGLTNGQTWSITVEDSNGCPYTMSGTYNFTQPTVSFTNIPSPICATAAPINLTGSPLPANVTSTTSGTGGTVPDPGSVDYTISTSIPYTPATGTLNNIVVSVNINHTWANDLWLTLTDPCGNAYTLVNGIHGDDNYSGVYNFTMSAAGPIPNVDSGGPNAIIPTGNYDPITSFAPMMSCAMDGVWTLTAMDDAAIAQGTIGTWSVSFLYTTLGSFAGPGTTNNLTAGVPNGTGVFNPATAGSGVHDIVYTYEANGCVYTSTQTVTVVAGPTVDALDKTICSGQSTNITLNNTSGQAGVTYAWTVVGTTGGVTGASAGSGGTINQVLTGGTTVGTVTYSIIATGPAPTNCVGPPLQITVTVTPPPAFNTTCPTTPNATLCAGNTIQLCLDADKLPTGTTAVQWMYSTTAGFDPYTTGTLAGSVGTTPVASPQSWISPIALGAGSGSTCPILYGIMVDPCGTTSAEEADAEYVVLINGSNSLNTNNIALDFPNTGSGAANEVIDITTGNNTDFSANTGATPGGACIVNATNGTVIPPNVPIVIFPSNVLTNSAPQPVPDLTSLCEEYGVVYVLYVNRNPTTASLANGTGESFILSTTTCGATTYTYATPTGVYDDAQGYFATFNGTTAIQNNQSLNGCSGCNPDWSSVGCINFTLPAAPASCGNTYYFKPKIVSSLPLCSQSTIASAPQFTVVCPVVTDPTNINVCAGATVPITTFTSAPLTGISYLWSNNNTAIGLAASGTGNQPAFTATNATAAPIVGTVTVTPYAFGLNGIDNNATGDDCVGPVQTYTITVNPIPTANAGPDRVKCVGAVSIGSASVVGNSYSWSPTTNLSNPLISNLTADPTATTTYTVTVTSAAGCTATDAVLVTVGTVTASATTTSNTNCTAPYNGTVNLTPNPAASNTFSWNTGATTEDLSAVANGTYTVTVTAASGCTNTATATIANNPTLPTITMGAPTANTACAAPYTGAVAVTAPTGAGVGYLWSTSATTAGITAANGGTYTVTVTGTNGCTNTSSATIANNPTLPTASASATNNTNCAAPYNGAVSLTSNGSSFAWSNGATTQNLSALQSGTFTVTVTAANGCTNTASATIANNSAAPVITMGSPTANTACAAPFNGSVAVTAPTGAGITYAWSTGATTAGITAANGGTYTVTVTAAGGCTNTATATIANNPTLPTITMGAPTANTACAAPYTGAVAVTAPTGAGVGYLWSTSATTAGITAANGGTYTVTVTAVNGCTNTSSATIANTPTLPTASASATDNTNCTAPYNGAVSLTSNGSSFAWSNGATTQNLSALQSGTFTVTVTAANGCTNTASATVANNSAAPVITMGSPTANTACAAPFNGSVAVTAPTGAGITYAWSTGATTAGITAANGGTYTVTVTAAGGCTNTATATVANNPTLPTITMGAPTANTACAAPYTGVVAVTAPTGAGVGYLWSTSATTAGITAANGGTYTVTVTAVNGCTNTSSATIANTPTLPTASASATDNTNCTAPYNGAVSLTSNGSSFAWSNGATTQNLSALQSGTFTVTVTAANGCTNTASATVSDAFTPPTITMGAPLANTACAAPFNGSVAVTAPTGAGITYAWSTGATTAGITAANGGTYTVTVTAAGGCTNTATATIANNPTLPTITMGAPTANTACAAPYTGAVAVTAPTGAGVGYLWGTSATTAGITAANGGTYTVTVTAVNGCTNTSSATIANTPTLPTASASATDNTNCTAPYNGAVSLTSNGSSFAWSNGATTQNLSALQSGTFTVTVTAANGCTNTASATVSDAFTPPTITMGAPLANTACVAPFNGSVAVTAPTGVGISYAWSTGETTAGLSNVDAGTYTVTVTAANGCTNTSSATIANTPTLPTASASATDNTNCAAPYNGAVSLTSNGSSFVWSNGATTQNLSTVSAGTYTVTVTAANGCTNTASATVADAFTPPTITMGAPLANTACVAPFNGSVAVTAPTGVGISYVWNTGETMAGLSNVDAGTYTVTVTAANGCTNTSSATIANTPTLPTASASATDNTNCAAPYNGAVSLTSNGSSFVWSNGATTQNLSTVSAGTYTVTVTAANGCTNTASATVSDAFTPPTITMGAPLANTACVAPFNGSVAVTAPTGVGVGYLWSTSATTAGITAANGGTYTVTVTGTNGCTNTSSATIANTPTLPTASASATDNTNCAAPYNGAVSLTSNGSSFVWSNGATTQNLSALQSGTFTVTVTAANGCTNTASATVANNSAAPVITMGSPTANTACAAPFNGSVAVTAPTGAGITYAWSTGATTAGITAANGGTYTVTVTAAGGCTNTATATIANNPTLPTITMGAPTANTACAAPYTGAVAVTAPTGAGVGYLWSTSATTAGITAANGGTYTVTVTAVNGCTNTSSATIANTPTLPTASASATNNTNCTAPYNGAVSLTSNGSSFVWSNGATTQNLSTVSAGTYTVTVTAANGCTNTASATVADAFTPPTITMGAPVANTACVAPFNGSVAVTAPTGVGISYAWNTGETTVGLSNVDAGTYTVTVTAANGCTNTSSATIANTPTLPTASASATNNTNCTAPYNGAVSLTSNGSSFVWSNGATTQNLSTVSAGTYTVTVTAANGCTNTASATVSDAFTPPTITMGAPVANTACVAPFNGSVAVTAPTGVGISYAWNTGETTVGLSNVDAGTYTVTVTAANGCTNTSSATIANTPTLPTASASATNNTNCTAPYNGAVSLTSNGSSFVWSNGATTQNLSTVSAGTYTVTVTAANGCTNTASATVGDAFTPPTITMGAPLANTACVAPFNGSVAVTAPTGVGVGYLWSTSATTAGITAANGGTYTVTVTGTNGCTNTSSATIANTPTLPTASASATDNTNCAAPYNGAVSLTSNGSSFVWSNGATTQNLSALQSGTFTVTVTAANGCTNTASATVANNSAAPVITMGSPTANTACAAPFNGSVAVTAPTGAGITYAWSTGATTAGITAANGGTYTVTVTAAGGCTNTATATIANNPTLPTITMGAPTANTACAAPYTGAVAVTAPTGAGVGYLWSTSATTAGITAANGGTYTVTVTAVNGCTNTSSATIANTPTLPTASASATNNTNCTAPYNGAVSLTSNGSSFVWSNGATTQNLSTVSAGTYTVTVTAANGCTNTASATVADAFTPPTITMGAPVANTACVAPFNGSVAVTAPTGVGISYAWNTGETTVGLSNVDAGTYTVTVTAANGCTNTSSATIANTPTLPTASASATNNTNCTAPYNGAVSLTSNGSSFVWSNGATTQNLSTVSAGTYTVTVTAANGCTNTASATVSDAFTPPTITMGAPVANTACVAPFNGSVAVTAPTGVGISYAWNTGETTVGLSNVDAGTYTVTVTAANGCTNTSSATIANTPTLPTASASATNNTNCTAPYNGAVSLTSNGSSFVWSNGATTQNLSTVSAGTYTVTVTAANGCTNTASATVGDAFTPPTITMGAPLANTACVAPFNGSVAVTAPTGVGISYVWNTGETTAGLSNVDAGTYTVTVTDINGCSNSALVLISNNIPLITATPNVLDNTNCVAPFNGSITLVTNGSNFTWSTGDNSQDLTNIGGGSYTVTVTDANGCSTTATATISDPAIPTASATSNPTTCGLDNGSINLSISNISTPVYSWSNGAISEDLTNIASGSYTVTITGDGSCSATTSVDVAASLAPTLNANLTPSTCGLDNGAIDLTINNMTAPVVAWSNLSNLEDLSDLAAGDYTVTVTGTSGCSASATYTIDPSNAIVASIDNTGIAFCEGNSTDLSAIGGGAGAVYEWSTAETTASISVSPTSNTSYIVTITENGCSGSAEVNITVHALPIAAISGSPTYCVGESTVLGAPAGMGYEWSTGETTQDITVSTPNTYAVTITDANGCTASDNVIVTEEIQLMPNVTGGGNICANTTATLDAGTGFTTYTWSNGETTQTIDVVTDGTYIVTVTSATCSGTGSATVIVNPLPTPQIDGNAAICANETSTLSVSGGAFASYEWQDGSFSDTYVATTTGAYSVTVTDNNGCSAAANFDLTVNSNPIVSIDGLTGFCPNSSTDLTALPAGATYEWSNAAVTQTITATTAGVYEVTVTDANTCSASAAINVTQYILDAPILSDATICADETATLDAGIYDTYIWSSSETTQSITVNTANTYSVTVSDANACTATASAVITVNPLPALSISGSTSICPNSTLTLSATTGMSSYLWDTNDGVINGALNGETIDITSAGTYTVVVSDANSCTATASLTVIPSNSLSVNIGGDTNLCQTESTTLDAGTGFTSYIWSNAETTQTITVSPTDDTMYSVTVSDGSCDGSGSVVVVVNAIPIININGSSAICSGETINLNASPNTYTTYSWSGGIASGADLTDTPNSQTTYTVSVTDANACSNTATHTVDVSQPVDAGADNSASVCNDALGGATSIDLATLVNNPAIGSFSPNGTPALTGTTFEGNGLSSGVYTYNYTVAAIAPCLADVAVVTITVNNCSCPTITAALSDTESICNNATIDLATYEAQVIYTDPAGSFGSFTWYADAALTTPLNAATAFAYSGNGCDVQSVTAYLGMTCSLQANPIAAGSLVVSIYPDFSAALLTETVGNCAPPTLTTTCANYVITAVNVPATVNAGDSGNAEWTVTYSDGSGFATCFSETVNVAYSCPALGCPTITAALSDAESICNGDAINLANYEAQVIYNDPDGSFGSFAWYADAALTTPLNAATAFAYSGNGCDVQSVTAYLGMTCSLQANPIAAGSLVVSIYPDFSAALLTETVGNCAPPTLTTTCANYVTTAVNVPATVNAGDSGNAEWTVTYSDGSGFATCFSETVNVAYSCPALGCPTITAALSDAESICNGDAINLANYEAQVIYNDPDGSFGSFAWYADAALTTPLNAATAFAYSGNGCDVQSVTAYLGMICSLQANPIAAGSLVVSIYPDFSAALLTETVGNCAPPTLTTTCANYVITAVNVPATVNAGDSGNAEWTVTYNDGSGFATCFSQTVNVEYSCPALGCPTITAALSDAESICNGDAINLTSYEAQVTYNDPDGSFGSFAWYADAALTTPLNAATAFAYSGNGCDVQSVTAYLGMTCNLQANPIAAGNLVVTIYPDFSASLLTETVGNCSVPTLTTTCANYVITAVNVPATVNAGDSGNAEWTVTYNDGSGFATCFSQTVNVEYSCPALGCPTITAALSDAESICNGDAINLTSYEAQVTYNDPDGSFGSFAWYADAALTTPLNAATAFAYSGNSCDVQSVTAYLGMTCSLQANPIAAGSLTVSIYPDFSAALLTETVGNCAPPTLTTTCANYVITAVNVPATVNAGDSGNAEWTVTYSDGSGFATCFSETVNVAYSCPALGCPTITAALSDAESICNGDAINLANYEAQVIYNDPDGSFGSFAWYADAALTTPLNAATAFAYSGNGCDVQSVTAYLGMICSLQANPIAAGSLTVSIYPDFSAALLTETVGNCAPPTLTTTCANYVITAVNVPATVNAGDSGNAEWTVTYSDGSGFATCFSETVNVAYSCPALGCPTITAALSDAESICNGDAINLANYEAQVIYNDPDGSFGGFTWYADAALTTPLNAATAFAYSGNGCDVQSVTAYLGMTCSLQANPIAAGNLVVTIYPDFSASLLTETVGNCSVPTLTTTCANYVITPVNVPATVNAGDSGNAEWTVTYSDGSGFATCFSQTVNVEYSCPALGCPTITAALSDAESICNGDAINLTSYEAQVTYNDPDGSFGSFAWYADAALTTPLNAATAFAYSGNGCDVQSVTAYLGMTCSLQANPIAAGNLVVTIYPDFSASLLTETVGNCSVPTLTTTCANYVITAVNVPATVNAGDSGNAEWTVTYSDGSGFATCFSETVNVEYSCPALGCPTITAALSDAESICNNATIDFAAYEAQVTYNDPDGSFGSFAWYADAALTTPLNAATAFAYSGNGCDVQSVTAYLGMTCSLQANPIAAGSLVVSIYPDFSAALLTETVGNCSVPTLTTTCANYVITPVNVPATVNAGDSGNAEWTVTYSDGSGFATCFSQTVNVEYSCPALGCPTITAALSDAESICNGDAINLTSYEAQVTYNDPDGSFGSFAWYADAALTTPLNAATAFAYSGNGCDVQSVTAYLGMTCNLQANPIAAGSLTVTIYPDFSASLLTETVGNCSVPTVTTICANYVITAVNVPATVNAGDSGNAEWTVTYSNGSGFATCFSETVNVEYSCPALPCPEAALTATPDICLGEAVTVTFTGTAGVGATFSCQIGTQIFTGVGPYTYTPTVAGDLTVTLTVTENGCDDVATATVAVADCGCVAPPVPTALVNNLIVCSGEVNTAAFTLTAVPNTSINWYNTSLGGSPIATGTSFVPTAAGIYYAEAVNVPDDGCVSARIPFVFQVDVVSLGVTVQGGTIIELGSSVVLLANASSSLSGDITYSWSPSATLSCANCANPTATPTETTTYMVTAVDEFGCSATASVTITVFQENKSILPNAFSPNGDGVDDIFHVTGKNIVSVDLYIYNRWGNEIYAATDISTEEGWDGKYKGMDVEIAVFVYYASALL
jgi:gliding motility-associated-like protein